MPNVIDLFRGAGGLSYGFELAGYNVVAAIDHDPIPCETYRLQNPSVPLLTDDVAKLSGRHLARVAGAPVDVIIGGPSCQGFSTHGKRDPNDPRNFLFHHFIRLVKEIRPSWVVMENVKGLLTYDKGVYRDIIHTSFERIGYSVSSRILRAVDYGVPQFRERLFFIATNTSIPITFPEPTHCSPEMSWLTSLKPYVTLREAIGDLPEIGEEGEGFKYATPANSDYQKFARRNAPSKITLHRARKVSPLAMSIISRVPQGQGIRAIPEHKLPARFRRMRTVSNGALRRDCTTLYHRLAWNRPSYTITCYFTNVSSGPFVHSTQHRSLTPREAARLQSFPDNYKFFDKQIQRQIGNAVPPLLARAVAREILKKLNGKAKSFPKHTRSLLAYA